MYDGKDSIHYNMTSISNCYFYNKFGDLYAVNMK